MCRSLTDARLCTYHLFVWLNLNFLHIPQWITLLNQSCLIFVFLYVFLESLYWCINAVFDAGKLSSYLLSWLLLLLLLLLLLFLYSFLHQRHLIVFHWSSSDSKTHQVPRTLLSFLAISNNAVVWMVFTRPSTSKSSSPFSNCLVTEPKAPITIGTIIRFMFHSFFNSLARSRYLFFFSDSFSFIQSLAGTTKSTILQMFFFFGWLILGLVFWPRLRDPCVCQSHIGVYACYFLRQVLGCA